jgi:hypothetical protein
MKSKDQSIKPKAAQRDELDFRDKMDNLDARISAVGYLCVATSPESATPGTEIAEIGHILLEYLENKTKLEKKYRRKKR